MSASDLSLEDYMLYKEFEEFKAFKQQKEQEQLRNVTMTPSFKALDDLSATRVIDDVIPNNLLKIQNTNNRSAFPMYQLLSSTPISVIDAQVALDKKVLGLINDNFNERIIDGSSVYVAKTYKYAIDISGTTPGSNHIDIPTLSFTNLPSFTFSSFSFDVALEDRGTDSSGLLVTPSKMNSKFTTYKLNMTMIDRGEPLGLSRLKGLLIQKAESSATITGTAAQQQSGTAKNANINRGLDFDTTK